jgi:nitrogen regulatory protein PII
MQQEMVLVIFNSSIEDEMVEALREAGMTCYTKIPGVQGAGTCSEPRLDCHVWPGTNTMYLIAIEPEKKDAVCDAIRRMQDKHKEEGVKAFIFPINSCI